MPSSAVCMAGEFGTTVSSLKPLSTLEPVTTDTVVVEAVRELRNVDKVEFCVVVPSESIIDFGSVVALIHACSRTLSIPVAGIVMVPAVKGVEIRLKSLEVTPFLSSQSWTTCLMRSWMYDTALGDGAG